MAGFCITRLINTVDLWISVDICGSCSANQATADLSLCSGCHSVRFCSRDHQRRFWPRWPLMAQGGCWVHFLAVKTRHSRCKRNTIMTCRVLLAIGRKQTKNDIHILSTIQNLFSLQMFTATCELFLNTTWNQLLPLSLHPLGPIFLAVLRHQAVCRFIASIKGGLLQQVGHPRLRFWRKSKITSKIRVLSFCVLMLFFSRFARCLFIFYITGAQSVPSEKLLKTTNLVAGGGPRVGLWSFAGGGGRVDQIQVWTSGQQLHR